MHKTSAAVSVFLMLASRIRLTVLVLAVCFTAALGGQDLPKFEIATLKPSPPPTTASFSIVLGAFQNGRFRFVNTTLDDMVQYAFDLPSKDLLVGLDWSDTERFDVQATAPSETPTEQVRVMVQQLLKERLHLVTRIERRTLRHAALVVGNDGPKMKPTIEPLVPMAQSPGRINHNRMTMGLLASLLSRFEQMIVVDQTGLREFYEVRLEWASDTGILPGDPARPPPDRPSLFAAVGEQLGLRLESRRAPLDVIVIQEASRIPEPN